MNNDKPSSESSHSQQTKRASESHPTDNQTSQWISIKERLPDNCKNVLCATKLLNGKPALFIGIYTKGSQIEFYNHDDEPDYLPKGWYELEDQYKGDYDQHWFDREVTHWMPLPKPPEP